MRNKIVFVFTICLLLIGCGTGKVKTEKTSTKEMIIQLHGKKYDQLLLQASLPGKMSHGTSLKVFSGQSTDGYRWTFNIPDSINEETAVYYILTRHFDLATKTAYYVEFKGLSENDPFTYDYVYDEKNPVVEATYLETKFFKGEPGDGNSLAVDTSFVEGASLSRDIFKVDFKKKDTELELSMKFSSFCFIDKDHYAASVAEKDSISRRYPDSKYLMYQFYYISQDFNSIDDAKRIYDNFSDEAKSTWFGRECGNYIRNFSKLYSSAFENISLTSASSGKSEPMILDSTKYNLLIFSASWCVGCHALIPTLMDVYNDLNPDLQMVYISLDEYKTVDNWKKLLAEKNIPWRSLLAAGCVKEIEDKFDAGTIPHMLLVYPDKKVKKIDLRIKEDKEELYKLVKQKK
jgi:thiol-disulfide isomerase/thioredoxin